jgi:uncharacterized repeat protein (TIGR01451 family)
MQFMQMLKASLTPRRSILATVVMVGVVASVMGLTPTHGASNTLAESCANPPTTPTFNYWPVTYDDVNTPFCHDFPAIDAALDTTNPQWSQSESDWSNGLNLNVGDQAAGGIYIHNGAANNLDPHQTTAKNVHIITQTDTTPGTDHQITVTFTADNAAPYTKSFTVHTPANAKLEVVPNSGFMYDYQGRVVLDSQNLNLGNSDYALGDLDACFEFSLFLTYKFKVIGTTPPPVDTNTTLSITKTVRNTTFGGASASYTSSVNGMKNDKVGYKVKVTNTGSSVAKNVTMTDNGVAGVSIDSSSTIVSTVDNQFSTIATPAFSGSLPGTLNLGDINPGESRYIFYTGTITASDCPTLVNTARAVATNAPQVTASATVVVVNNCNPPIDTSHPGISIKKFVKNNTTSTSYDDNAVTAYTNDSVNFKVTLTNTGNAVLNNAVVTVSGSTFTANFGSINAGQTKTVEFSAKVISSAGTSDLQICNTATGTGTGVSSVNDQACVNIPHVIVTPHNPSISIKKYVKNNSTATSYDDNSVTARTGEKVNFKVVVSNPSDTVLNNVVMTDIIPSGLQYADNVTGDGQASFSGSTLTVNFGSISAGQSKTVEFTANVIATASGSTTTNVCNIAKAIGTSVSEVSDNACVSVYTTPKNPGQPHITISKSAKNDTKNADATSVDAARGDYITYTLVTTNDGDADQANYVISDDLSEVLPLADMVSTNGGTVSGNTITYPSITIKPGETVTKTFQVRIKQTLDTNLSYQLRNTYGNTVVIRVPGKIIYQAPTTGAAGTSAVVFAGLVTAGFVVLRKRNSLAKLIFA